MFTEDLTPDYTWKIIETTKTKNLYKGSYFDELYFIIENFEDEYDTILSFFAIDSVAKNTIISLKTINTLEPNFNIYGFKQHLNKKSISIYKDDFDEEAIILVYSINKKVFVYENDSFILDEAKEYLDDTIDEFDELFPEVKSRTSIEIYITVVVLYYLLKDSDF